MNRKRDIQNIGKTYQEILDKKIPDLWILFLYYDYSSNKQHKFKLMPFDENMSPKWKKIFSELKREKLPKWAKRDIHIVSFQGKQKRHADSKRGYYMRTAHVSDKEYLEQILREAFYGDIEEEDELIDNMKPETKKHFGDIFSNI